MKKTAYIGMVKGKPTRVEFQGDEPDRKLSRFCTKYQADITTFVKK